MTERELTRAIRYGAHTSDTKETSFIRTEIAEQSQAGYITLYPLWTIRHLPRLWLSTLEYIPQRGIKPRLIYDFS